MGNWSELPADIIQMISMRIDNPFDLIHFRSICSLWRSSSVPTFRQDPSLRCPHNPDDGGLGDCHIVRSRVYLIKSLSHDPPRYWLFKLQEEENGSLAMRCFFSRTASSARTCKYPSLSLDLLNSQLIELAEQHVICYISFWPCAEIIDPISLMFLGEENKEFMIMRGIPFRGLSIYRSFQGSWTKIKTTPGDGGNIERITSFNGKFYVIGPAGVTKVVKPTLEVNSFQRSRPCDKTILERWFVKSEDKLLLVEMCIDDPHVYYYRRPAQDINEICVGHSNIRHRHDYYPTRLAEKGWFEVSELNEERNDWIQLEDLGGRVLFLDSDRSFACLSNHFPSFRANSIIFPASFGRFQFQVFEFGQQGFSPSIFRFCHLHHR